LNPALSLITAALFICAISWATPIGAAEADGAAKQTFVLGKVTANARKSYKRLRAMADYLGPRLNDLGIRHTRIKLARTNREMVEFLRRGEVDCFSESPLSALYLAENGDAEILLREWKKGAPSYHTVFIARKGSGIESLSDLRGKKIVFEDPGSTSAYLVPFSILRGLGFSMVEMASVRDPLPAGKGGYVFGREEMNIPLWVQRGLADAGAFSDQDWRERTPAALKKALKIIHRTAPILRSVLSVRRTLRPDIKRRLKQLLLGMHKDAEGRRVLKKYYKVAKYDEIEGEAADQLANARKIYSLMPMELAR
jgi:phosphonate transport system substrate-binding protein